MKFFFTSVAPRDSFIRLNPGRMMIDLGGQKGQPISRLSRIRVTSLKYNREGHKGGTRSPIDQRNRSMQPIIWLSYAHIDRPFFTTNMLPPITL